MVEEKNNPNEPKNSGVALLDKEEVKEETKTLFEKIWEFILKILDLLKVKK